MPKKKEYYSKTRPKAESDGWMLARKYKPEAYALVKVKDAEGKINNGWWTGWKWDYGIQRTFGRIDKWQPLREKIV